MVCESGTRNYVNAMRCEMMRWRVKHCEPALVEHRTYLADHKHSLFGMWSHRTLLLQLILNRAKDWARLRGVLKPPDPLAGHASALCAYPQKSWMSLAAYTVQDQSNLVTDNKQKTGRRGSQNHRHAGPWYLFFLCSFVKYLNNKHYHHEKL